MYFLNVSSSFKENIKLMHSNLVIDKSYDIVERIFKIGGKDTVLYYINGFIKDDIMEEILKSFISISVDTMNSYKIGRAHV